MTRFTLRERSTEDGPVSLPKMLLEEDYARNREHGRDAVPPVATSADDMNGSGGSYLLAGGTDGDRLPPGPVDSNKEKYILIDGKYRLNPNYNPPFDITLGQAIAIPPLIGVAGALLPEAAAATGAAYRFARYGGELKLNPRLKIAPFGNRTNHPTGKWPHYHRRPSMDPPPGQGIDRHRPWDKNKELDKSWRDRF